MKRVALALVLPACAPAGAEQEPWAWDLPAHLERPIVPSDQPLTVAKVELGRHLFYEERLSMSGDVSCGTCHVQALAFSDGFAVSVGADGRSGTRSAMSLGNVAYMPTLTWGNPVLETLEAQALVPLFVDVPLEMGAQYVIADALEAFASEDAWIDRFDAAFAEGDPFTIANVAAALAAFERTLVSADSPFDRWLQGDASALAPEAQRGLSLFDAHCGACHTGALQTASVRDESDPEALSRFENTGLYEAYPQPNFGLYEFTRDPHDVGRHRVPSLRNIAVTAPYMHDGSIADLHGVIDHYAAGGRADNPDTSELVPGFAITDDEREDLIAFLHALTDETFLADPRFADPRE